MGSTAEPNGAAMETLDMAALVKRFGWPPSVIEQQDLNLLAQVEALDTFTAFSKFSHDPASIDKHEAAIVGKLERHVRRRLLRQKSKSSGLKPNGAANQAEG